MVMADVPPANENPSLSLTVENVTSWKAFAVVTVCVVVS